MNNEINRLKEQLWYARQVVLNLMPDEIRNILSSYYQCKSSEEVWHWEFETAEKIINLAQPRPANEMGSYGSITDRAYCPLCKGSSMSPFYEQGFAFPEGLRRHLLGSHNSSQCEVFEIALAMCKDHVADTISRTRLNRKFV